MKPNPRFSLPFVKCLSVTLSLFLVAQIALADAAQTNFWAERRKSMERSKESQDEILLASLPSTISSNPSQVFKELPSPRPHEIVSQGIVDDSLSPASETELTTLMSALQSAYGNVRETFVPQKAKIDKTVILIQDVHMNQEAQENIGKAVQELIDQGKVGLIGLEGATKPIDLAPLRSFPYPDITKKVADYMLKVNKITGPIHAGLTSEKSIPSIIGVDDPTHYKANVEAYKQSAGRQAQYKLAIGGLQARLAQEKKTGFNPALQKFDNQVEAYRKGALKLGEYLRSLSQTVSDTPLSIETFLAALDMEEKLDFSRVEKERTQILEKLVQKLKKDQILDLVRESLTYRLGKVSHSNFYAYLRDLCKKNGVSLAQYPAMDSYIRYVLLSDSFKADQLFRDVTNMEQQGYARLAQTPQEKALVAESKRLYLTGKLVDFALTTQEWEEYRSEKAVILSGAKNLGVTDLSSFEAFYQEAEIRNQSITENLLKAMDKNNTKVAVLVAGGFHSQGIEERLKTLKVASLTFVPKITQVDTENGSKYLSVFTQEKTPLEKLFQGEKLFLATEPFRQDVGIIAAAADFAATVYTGQASATDASLGNWVKNVTPGAQGIPIYHEQVAQEQATVETIVSQQGNTEVFHLIASFSGAKGSENIGIEDIQGELLPTSTVARVKNIFNRVFTPANLTIGGVAPGAAMRPGSMTLEALLGLTGIFAVTGLGSWAVASGFNPFIMAGVALGLIGAVFLIARATRNVQLKRDVKKLNESLYAFGLSEYNRDAARYAQYIFERNLEEFKARWGFVPRQEQIGSNYIRYTLAPEKKMGPGVASPLGGPEGMITHTLLRLFRMFLNWMRPEGTGKKGDQGSSFAEKSERVPEAGDQTTHAVPHPTLSPETLAFYLDPEDGGEHNLSPDKIEDRYTRFARYEGSRYQQDRYQYGYFKVGVRLQNDLFVTIPLLNRIDRFGNPIDSLGNQIAEDRMEFGIDVRPMINGQPIDHAPLELVGEGKLPKNSNPIGFAISEVDPTLLAVRGADNSIIARFRIFTLRDDEGKIYEIRLEGGDWWQQLTLPFWKGYFDARNDKKNIASAILRGLFFQFGRLEAEETNQIAAMELSPNQSLKAVGGEEILFKWLPLAIAHTPIIGLPLAFGIQVAFIWGHGRDRILARSIYWTGSWANFLTPIILMGGFAGWGLGVILGVASHMYINWAMKKCGRQLRDYTEAHKICHHPALLPFQPRIDHTCRFALSYR